MWAEHACGEGQWSAQFVCARYLCTKPIWSQRLSRASLSYYPSAVATLSESGDSAPQAHKIVAVSPFTQILPELHFIGLIHSKQA